MLISCSTAKNYQKITYIGYSNSTNKYYKYKTKIKKGFRLKEINGGNEWSQNEYIYLDNSIFYISNEQGNTSLNYDNIKNNQITSEKSVKAFFTNDTITLQGIDKNGLYWKNKFDGVVNIGYLNVPKEEKSEFDKILLSLSKK